MYIVGVGGANIDMHAKSRSAVIMRDSNPSMMHCSAGGVTRNILDNLAHQGLECRLLSAVGTDLFGDSILDACRRAGIDVSQVYLDPVHPSSCYFAMLDHGGDMLLGASDMRIVEALPPSYLDGKAELLQNAAAIVCDANPSTRFIERLLDLSGDTPVFADPVSTGYAQKLKPLIGRFYLIKPNLMELEVLSGISCTDDEGIRRACGSLLDKGLRRIVVSLGGRGCYYADREGRSMFRSLRRVDMMADATGAGDAFMAGLVHGCCLGHTPEQALDYALASGIIAVMSEETINPAMSDALVMRVIEEYR